MDSLDRMQNNLTFLTAIKDREGMVIEIVSGALCVRIGTYVGKEQISLIGIQNYAAPRDLS